MAGEQRKEPKRAGVEERPEAAVSQIIQRLAEIIASNLLELWSELQHNLEIMKPTWRAFSAVLWMLALTCLVTPLVASDTALVVKKSNLRKDPSAQHTPIRVLLPDEELIIVDSTTSPRYLKVKTEDKKTGWVWKNAVEILPDTAGNAPVTPAPAPSATPTPTASPTGAPVADAISPDWPKPDPVDEDFEGSEGTCGGTGDGGDKDTNARKNRSDPLPDPHDVT
jgi:hypothetical protein